MGRPYGVKGRKKKRKLEEAATSDAAPPAEEVEELPPQEEAGGEEKGNEEDEAAAGEEEHAAVDGIPIVPRTLDGKRRPGAIFVLERACLEVGKVGKVPWFGWSKKFLFFFFFIVLFLFRNKFNSGSVVCSCTFQLRGFVRAIGLLRWFSYCY
jgi:hypothetical protein